MVEAHTGELVSRMMGSSGLITDLIRFPRFPSDFRFHVVTARVDEAFESGLAESVARCIASGVSEDPEIAAAAAVGEAWERIAFVNAINGLQTSPSASCPPQADEEEIFRLPFLLDRDANREKWAKQAQLVATKNRSYIQYDLGVIPRERELPAAILHSDCVSTLFETTNGLACADSTSVALDRAVRELVERDALMLVWLTKSGGRCVKPANFLEPAHCEQIERMSNMGIRTVLRDISTGFGIRVFLAAITSEFPENRTGIAFGAGAHRSAALAARHAFKEACLSWRGVAWRSLTGDSPAPKETPSSFAAHSEYYSSWDRMHMLDFLLDDVPDSSATKDDTPIEEHLRDSGHVDLLLSQGFRVLSADITPAQAADTGLKVVQAVVPGLVPLYLGDRVADALAWRRLPASIGGSLHDKPATLNPAVHPWP